MLSSHPSFFSFVYCANFHLEGSAQACAGKKKVIIVKNNYDDAVWWSERKMSCVLPIPLSLWCLITDDPGVAFNGIYTL